MGFFGDGRRVHSCKPNSAGLSWPKVSHARLSQITTSASAVGVRVRCVGFRVFDVESQQCLFKGTALEDLSG